MTTADTKRRISDWFRQWRSPLRKFLLGRAGVPASDVDDVAQEVFVRLIRYEKSELIENPQAYLFKMATNVAAEWAIRARHRQPHESKWLAALIGEKQTEAEVLRAQSQAEVERALNTLTPHQRAVLKLFFTEELGHAEIAAQLGESLRSVRRHFAKSYEKLRHELDLDLLEALENGAISHGRE